MLLLKKGGAEEVFCASECAQSSACSSFSSCGWKCAALWSVSCCAGASPQCRAPAGRTQKTSSGMDTPITAEKCRGSNSMPPQELISPPRGLFLFLPPLRAISLRAMNRNISANKSRHIFVGLSALSSYLRLASDQASKRCADGNLCGRQAGAALRGFLRQQRPTTTKPGEVFSEHR